MSIQFIYKVYIPESVSETVKIKVRKRLTNFFTGYTMYETTGAWKGLYEQTEVYEIISDERIMYVFESIKADMLEDGEEAVLITMDTITVL